MLRSISISWSEVLFVNPKIRSAWSPIYIICWSYDPEMYWEPVRGQVSEPHLDKPVSPFLNTSIRRDQHEATCPSGQAVDTLRLAPVQWTEAPDY